MSHAVAQDLTYGITAEFHDADELVAAAKRVREAGYQSFDCYSPFPIHGLDDAMGFKDTKVQWSILGAGIVGALVGTGLTWWTSTIAYPLNIGGRPKFSWPSFFPIVYECTILIAGLTALIACLFFNGLPKPYHPIFNAKNFERASQDRFFLCIEQVDPSFDLKETKKFMESLGSKNIDVVVADEEGKW